MNPIGRAGRPCSRRCATPGRPWTGCARSRTSMSSSTASRTKTEPFSLDNPGQPDGKRTDIGGMLHWLEQQNGGRRVRGLALLSDGRNNGGQRIRPVRRGRPLAAARPDLHVRFRQPQHAQRPERRGRRQRRRGADRRADQGQDHRAGRHRRPRLREPHGPRSPFARRQGSQGTEGRAAAAQHGQQGGAGVRRPGSGRRSQGDGEGGPAAGRAGPERQPARHASSRSSRAASTCC